jgi:hypothetical protein
MSSPAAPPTATPVPEALPQPDVYLAYTGPFDNLLLTLRDGRTGQTLRELDTPGPPIAAELSPNGQFLAYVAEQGQSGTNELWVIHVGSALGAAQDDLGRIETPLAEWDSMELGRSLAGSEFLEHVAWSPSSQYLAFTIAATDGTGSDAWLFDAGSAAVRQLTTTGTGFAASWVADSDSWAGERSRPQLLWVSLAGTQPTSQLIDIANPDTSLATTGTFQPLLSPDGARVIYWRGVMAASEDDGAWSFLEGGAPYLADVRASEDTVEFVNERPLFSDVTIDRDAFAAAGIVWGADSDAYAVWDAEWAGIPQGRAGEYPSVRRVYFGHASDERNLTEVHAIDEADLDLDATVVDIKVPTGRHLLITARLPIDGTLSVPRAQLILVTRNTGQVADEIERFTGPGEDAWFGPAANDARGEIPIEP